jgi:ssDNA-binding replication factor A large subunit
LIKIKDLKPNQKKVTLKVKITDFGDLRNFYKFGKGGRVCTALGKDETGRICIPLWNEEIDQVKVGDVIQVSGGYTNVFQGVLQLNAGRFGTIEVLDEELDIEPKK